MWFILFSLNPVVFSSLMWYTSVIQFTYVYWDLHLCPQSVLSWHGRVTMSRLTGVEERGLKTSQPEYGSITSLIKNEVGSSCCSITGRCVDRSHFRNIFDLVHLIYGPRALKRKVCLLSRENWQIISVQAVHPAQSAESLFVPEKQGKEDVSTHFNDGLRKIDFVLVYTEVRGRSGDQQRDVEASPGVLAAAQAFK